MNGTSDDYILFYFISFHFILFYFILFYFISFHFISFYFILFYLATPVKRNAGFPRSVATQAVGIHGRSVSTYGDTVVTDRPSSIFFKFLAYPCISHSDWDDIMFSNSMTTKNSYCTLRYVVRKQVTFLHARSDKRTIILVNELRFIALKFTFIFTTLNGSRFHKYSQIKLYRWCTKIIPKSKRFLISIAQAESTMK